MPIPEAPAAAPVAPDRQYQVLVVDDDEQLGKVIIDFLKLDVRFSIAEVCRNADEVRTLLGKHPSLDIVLSDCKLFGEEEHLLWLARHLAQQEQRSGLVAMTGMDQQASWQGNRPSDLPPHVAYHFLQKPFRLRDLLAVIKSMIAHIQARTSGEPPPAEEPPAPPEEPLFTTPINSFADLPALMAALPEDPTKVAPQEGAFDSAAALLSKSFENLIQLVRGEAQPFQEEWDRCFPTKKRESLLRLLVDDPAAEFVLDCCWHDINGLLTVSYATGKNWEEKERKKIQKHLAPAHCAFKKYCTTRNFTAFLVRQTIKVNTLREEYTRVNFSEGTDRRIHAPAGALMSIFQTFPSNAAKVSRGAEHMLDITFQDKGDYTEAVVFDDLPHFTEVQLAKLFDERLESVSGSGWGTGLQRLAHLLALMWGEDTAGTLPIESYHCINGQWWRKVPNSAPALVEADVVNAVCPTRPTNTTKFFILRFKHLAEEK